MVPSPAPETALPWHARADLWFYRNPLWGAVATFLAIMGVFGAIATFADYPIIWLRQGYPYASGSAVLQYVVHRRTSAQRLLLESTGLLAVCFAPSVAHSIGDVGADVANAVVFPVFVAVIYFLGKGARRRNADRWHQRFGPLDAYLGSAQPQ